MLKNLEIGKTCISCDSCRLICPENAIITGGQEYVIDNWSCTTCGLCIEICPEDSVNFVGESKESQ